MAGLIRIKNIDVTVQPTETHSFGKIYGFFSIYSTNKYGYESYNSIGYATSGSKDFIVNSFGFTFDESGNLNYTNTSTVTAIRFVGVIIGNAL